MTAQECIHCHSKPQDIIMYTNYKSTENRTGVVAVLSSIKKLEGGVGGSAAAYSTITIENDNGDRGSYYLAGDCLLSNLLLLTDPISCCLHCLPTRSSVVCL